MKQTYIFLAAALLVSSLGCRSIGPDSDVDRASLKVGDPFSRDLYEVSGDHVSKWVLSDNETHEKRVASRRLSPDEVQAFWRSLDEADVEQWLPLYEQTHFDGRSAYGDWQLDIARKGRVIHSAGGQAFPADLNPRKQIDLQSSRRYERVWKAFSLMFDGENSR